MGKCLAGCVDCIYTGVFRSCPICCLATLMPMLYMYHYCGLGFHCHVHAAWLVDLPATRPERNLHDTSAMQVAT
jgi:hypothetical protein